MDLLILLVSYNLFTEIPPTIFAIFDICTTLRGQRHERRDADTMTASANLSKVSRHPRGGRQAQHMSPREHKHTAVRNSITSSIPNTKTRRFGDLGHMSNKTRITANRPQGATPLVAWQKCRETETVPSTVTPPFYNCNPVHVRSWLMSWHKLGVSHLLL